MNYDTSTRVTAIIRVPWKQNSVGKHTMASFELQDLYKTLANLAGLEQPPAEWKIDGTDQSALFDDPSTPVKNVAWSQYDRCPEPGEPVYYHPNCEGVKEGDLSVMGYTMRLTDPGLGDWRYTRWLKWNGTSLRAEWDEAPVGVELYSHEGDDGGDVFEKFENENLAGQDKHAELEKKLLAMMKEHFDTPQDHNDDGGDY